MLKLTIPSIELYDEVRNEFHWTSEYHLTLEHSLVSLSKWESKWKKPFLNYRIRTLDESVDYIRCMTITQNVPEDAYQHITNSIIDIVNAYIDESQTATVITSLEGETRSSEFVTSELIYYWMFSYGIPMECQKWHLSRLMTLIKVFSVKNNQNPKKISPQDRAAQMRALNEERRRKYNTKG